MRTEDGINRFQPQAPVRHHGRESLCRQMSSWRCGGWNEQRIPADEQIDGHSPKTDGRSSLDLIDRTRSHPQDASGESPQVFDQVRIVRAFFSRRLASGRFENRCLDIGYWQRDAAGRTTRVDPAENRPMLRQFTQQAHFADNNYPSHGDEVYSRSVRSKQISGSFFNRQSVCQLGKGLPPIADGLPWRGYPPIVESSPRRSRSSGHRKMP